MFNSRSTTLAAALLVIAPAACADPLNNPLIEPGALPMTVTQIPLRPDNPAIGRVGALTYAGGLVLEGNGVGLGGFSALSVAPDGQSFLALSDIGFWVAGRLRFDANGRLIGAEAARADILLDQTGQPVNRSLRDAEAMVAESDGVVIAFEREHRLWRYARDGAGGLAGLPTPLTTPPGLLEAERNSGLEALARLADGRWVAISQGLYTAEGHLGWIGTGDGEEIDWQPFRYAAADGYAAADAVALPDGDLLVLERTFSMLGGFRTRLARVAADALAPGAIVSGTLLATLENPMSVDNFEAVAALPSAAGAAWILVASDDNFRPFQRTLLLAFVLDEP